jgi:hypothetical protein
MFEFPAEEFYAQLIVDYFSWTFDKLRLIADLLQDGSIELQDIEAIHCFGFTRTTGNHEVSQEDLFPGQELHDIVIGLHEIRGIFGVDFLDFQVDQDSQRFREVSLEAVELESDKVRPESSSLWWFRLGFVARMLSVDESLDLMVIGASIR